MAIDWTKLNKRWTFDFYLVAPLALTNSEELQGVDISSVSITEDYLSDTRVQAKLSYYDTGQVVDRNKFVRIVAKLEDEGYSVMLGTFIPTSDDVSIENGVRKTTLTLESTLYGISKEILYSAWVCTKGSTAQTNWRKILSNIERKYREKSNFGNRTYTQAVITEAGETVLSALYACMDFSDNRLGVDGDGYITIEARDMPRYKTESFNIDVTAGMVANGIVRSSNELSRPGHAVVKATNGKNVLYGNWYNPNSRKRAQIGYVQSVYKTMSDVETFTQSSLNSLAAQLGQEEGTEDLTWEITTPYMPISAGDVGTISNVDDIAEYQGVNKVLVKERELDLSTMTQKLTLRSVYSYYFNTYE